MIDKFGLCPNCKMDWNKGDILQTLKKLSLFQYATDDEVRKVAYQYGWTDLKPTNFSKIITHQIQGTTYLICPAFVCGHVFNPTTDEEFESLWALHQKLKEPVSDMVITMTNGVIETTPVLEDESPFHAEVKLIDNLMQKPDHALEQINERLSDLKVITEQMGETLMIPLEREDKRQTTHYGKDSTGSFSRFSQILRQGKGKTD